MKDTFQVGDLVRQKSNDTLWIVFETEVCKTAPEGYTVTIRYANWTHYGRGGSRIDYPEYYTLVQRSNRRQYEYIQSGRSSKV